MGNFVVYKSSAGSGKTFTLVKEYLRLSFAEPNKLQHNFKRILALTFTNKAAAEMKSRVIESLHQISNEISTSILGDLLCKELSISKNELARRAKIVLNQILHHYSDFAIGTIDSFTHKIVKTFAHDLNLPVNFNVELDVNGFYQQVVSELLNKIGEDPYVSKLLKEYVLIKAEDNASWDPEQLILSFSQLLQKENSSEHIQTLKKLDDTQLEEVRKQIAKIKSDYFAFMVTQAQKALSLINEHHLSDNDFHYKSGGPQRFFFKAAAKKAKKEDAGLSRLMEAIEKNNWLNPKATSVNNIDQLNLAFTEIAVSLQNFINEQFELYSLCQLIDKQIYPLLLLKKIEEISSDKKEEERLVFITEFNNKIFEIINNEPTPFIYERLGERYHHYLLDEFQDTSTLQWHNILPLLDNSLSNGWFNLIVGDGKQSIYRWRNANIKQFADLPEVHFGNQNAVVQERADNLKRNFTGLHLNSNYRSLKNIVEFNNSVFKNLSEKVLNDATSLIYSDLKQNSTQQEGGYISIESGSVESDLLDEKNYELIKTHIQSALDSGFLLKDICVLCRSNKHGNGIAHFLMQQNIPVVSSESLLIKHNMEVNVLISFLNVLVNPRDVISASVILNYLFQKKSISELEFHQSLTSLSERISLFKILSGLGIEINEGHFLLNNLLDNCILIVKTLHLNENGHFYLRFFLDEINEFLVSENSNISAFLEWWQKRSRKASLIIPQETNAVKIMSIHSSKGLEFPVVILPYCNWSYYRAQEDWVGIKNDKINLPVAVIKLSEQAANSGLEKELENEKQEQILDNLNLLYVAFTRAAERLHLITYTGSKKNSFTVSEWINTFATENLNSENFYSIGQLKPKVGSNKKEKTTPFPLLPLEFNASNDQIEIKAAYLHAGEDTEDAKKHGILIHWLLSKIQSKADLDKAIEQGLLLGYFDSGEAQALKIKLQEIIEAPEIKKYFLPEQHCLIEAEMILPEGEVLRPDRIIFEENETILIDYKTGKENHPKYAQQLQKYENALMDMGYPNIKKLLVYVDQLNIISLN